MSLYITSLNSGSNGNCYYIGNASEAVLVDAGISCKETETRMGRLGLKMQTVKAIFISHEHTDHVRGVRVLSSKYKIPVYITPGTQKHGRIKLEQPISFCAQEPVWIGSLCVTAFPKHHDASEPHSFVVSCGDTRVGIFTDIGQPCEHLVRHFSQCHAAFLEANYDVDMLTNGRYPYFLKSRITGGKGHLSNKQALDLFIAERPSYMSHLLLSHLSKDNNCPVLVNELFAPHAGNTTIVVASRYEETPVYNVGN